MTEETMFQSPEEFDNLLRILKQSIDDQEESSSPIDSPDATSSSSDEEKECTFSNEQVTEILSCLEENIKEPPMEMKHCSLMATFGPRRKPEMTFILSISDRSLAFNEKCSVELNGEEINVDYDYLPKIKTNTARICKTGYCVHARLYMLDENRLVPLKNSNPPPLSFVYGKDRFASFKDGQVKLRIRENLTMKHLPVSGDTPPQLLIQFTLTYYGEKLMESERYQISFTTTKKKKYAETTDIIFSPSKIPSSVAPLLEPATKRVKSEPIQCVPQYQFPTATAIWNSNSPVDIINYLEAQMMSSQFQQQQQQYTTPTFIPTVFMLVPTVQQQQQQPIKQQYSPQKSPRKFKPQSPTDLYSNIRINFSQPLGEVLPTMMPSVDAVPPTGKDAHVPIDPHQMECWLDSLSS